MVRMGILAGLIVGAAGMLGTKEPPPAVSRPNILLCLADDWSYPHASAYGDQVIHTPAFDRLAREGALFTHAFSVAPSCTASRAGILTGQAPHRLREGANLWSTLDRKYPVYPDLLETAGYSVGSMRKGWGPGNVEAGGRSRNPAGPRFRDFESFLASLPPGQPFCFWFGSNDPHRPYDQGSGIKAGLRPDRVVVPPFWPDTPEVRSDILDYYLKARRFDQEVEKMLQQLERVGRLENTLVIVTGDNGWPFPRAKANLYDAGTRQPLAVFWPRRFHGRQVFHDLVSLTDLAPTILEAAGLEPLPDMTGRSLLGLLTGQERPGSREEVFFERERHANVRRGNLGYPSRALRTPDFLFIRNLAPERWPAGDPELWFSVGPFGDVDGGPTKQLLLDFRGQPEIAPLYQLAFEPRPAEELYDLKKDPHQMRNVAGQSQYKVIKDRLRLRLDRWMKETGDPRIIGESFDWDQVPFYGEKASQSPPSTKPALEGKKP